VFLLIGFVEIKSKLAEAFSKESGSVFKMDGSKIQADGSKFQIDSLPDSTAYPERQPTRTLSPFARPARGAAHPVYHDFRFSQRNCRRKFWASVLPAKAGIQTRCRGSAWDSCGSRE
jgi:hypothetical protein